MFSINSLGSWFWWTSKKSLPIGQETVVSISKSSHRCLYMEVEVTMFIFTPLICGMQAKRENWYSRDLGSGNSTVLCLIESSNSPCWCQTHCCDRAHGDILGTAYYWNCSPVLLHRLPLFSFSLMEKQTSAARAGMEHFESARERWTASGISLPKSLNKLSSSSTDFPVRSWSSWNRTWHYQFTTGKKYLWLYIKIRNSVVL